MIDLPFGVAAEGLFGEALNDGRQGPEGTWDLVGGTLAPNGLHLSVRVSIPDHGLAVEPGPAVLFGGLHLLGDAGGDMGFSMRVQGLTTVSLPPCAASPCVYAADIVLSVVDLEAAIDRLERDATLMMVSAELTLVRTFGEGTWLQVLPFLSGPDGALPAAGRLGAIAPETGRIFPFGLFPADQATPIEANPFGFRDGLDYAAVVEEARTAAGDTSRRPAMTPALLHTAIDPPCEGSSVLAMHDASGNWVFQRPLFEVADIEAPLELPSDTAWWLTLHDGGGIDFDQGRQGWGLRLGPIMPTDQPMTIEGAFDCAVPAGSLLVDRVQVGETAQPTTAPAAPVVPTDKPPLTSAAPAVDGAPASPATTIAPGRIALLSVVVVAGLLLTLSLRGKRREGP
jgi:hypothetical protein